MACGWLQSWILLFIFNVPLQRSQCRRTDLETGGQEFPAGHTAEMRFEDWRSFNSFSKLYITFTRAQKVPSPTCPSPKTYVDDMRAGVPVVYADEKAYHKLGAVFHIQLGDGVLQPPQFAWRKDGGGHWVEEIACCAGARWQKDALPYLASQLSTAMGQSYTSGSMSSNGVPPLFSISP